MPRTLFDYSKQVQRFIRDARIELVDPEDIVTYINMARREVAMRAQCIRRLPRVNGAIISIPIPPPPAASTGGGGITPVYLRNPDGSLVLNPDGSPIVIGSTTSGSGSIPIYLRNPDGSLVLNPDGSVIVIGTTPSGGGGGGWVSPVTCLISPPDNPSGMLPFQNGDQAIASTPIVENGLITTVEVIYGGEGYFQPKATFIDAAGNTATTTPVTTVLNTLNRGQEVYPFSAFNLAPFPGVESVYSIRSVSIIYSNYRYSLPIYSFSVYQSQIRQYAAGMYQYVPTFGSQFGRGVDGSLYMYPVPSQTYQLEVDCYCLPQDLIADESMEAIPDPWTDAVPYYAASLAMEELQNWNSARALEDLFDKRMRAFGAYTLPGRAVNPYGRF